MHRFASQARGLASLPVLLVLGEPGCPASPAPKVAEESETSPLAKAEAVVAGSMDDHFTHAMQLDDAVIAGRLKTAKTAAGKLAAASPRSYPAEWMPWVLQLRDAAHQAETADDIAAAGKAVGEVVAACGACHAALGRGPAFAPAPAPGRDTSAMKVHKWAAERMWEGVVGPSDSAWTVGTQRFPTLPECSPDVGGEIVDHAAIEAAREQVTALTVRAASTTELRPRGALYGEYIATCAACHRSGC